MFGFGTFGHGHDLVVGKHSGLVSQLPAGAAQWLAASVAVVHQSRILHKTQKSFRNQENRIIFQGNREVKVGGETDCCCNSCIFCVPLYVFNFFFKWEVHLFIAFLITVGTLYYLFGICTVIHQKLHQTVLNWKGTIPFYYWRVAVERTNIWVFSISALHTFKVRNLIILTDLF